MNDSVQVNQVYLIFKRSQFLVDSSDKILIVTIACFLVGCGWTPQWEKYYAESFIAVYKGDPIEVVTASGDVNYIRLSWGDGEDYAYNSNGDAKDIYRELCVKHQDTEYDKWVTEPRNPNSANKGGIVFWKDFVAIDVVSDRDFDTEHPAGSSLGDVVMYWGFSYWEWVKSGYSLYDENGLRQEVNSVEGCVNNIPEEGLCLIKELSLHFPSVPDSAVGDHNLTITITADDGTVYELSCLVMLEATEAQM